MSDIELIRTPSLGDNSFLLISGDEAAVVDPQRDAWPLIDACTGRGLSVRYVLETHVHNDYVSGAREWQAATGAVVAGPARAAYAFPHLPLDDGEEITVGDVTVCALATPGHTPEHTAYLVFEPGATAPTAVFTGGSLMVGGAGRTDLLGPDRAEELTRAQFRSLRRLLALAPQTRVLPTHGAGSFCAASTAGSTTSTLDAERRTNPALSLLNDEERFVRDRLTGLPRHPTYYRHMAPTNRAGPAVLSGLPSVPSLSPEEAERAVAAGAWIVDGRNRWSFADAHLPGSVNVELDDSFAAHVGSVVPFGGPLVLLLPEPTGPAAVEARTQLLRIGYDAVSGVLAGGVAGWQASERPVAGYPACDICELPVDADDVTLLDVRQPGEWAAGVLPGSRQIFLGDLPQRIRELPCGRRVWAVCASGRRAAVAASLLDRAGIPTGVVASGGVPTRLAAAA
ncbi:MAG: Hydrolase [Frankiales bacterium]|nr:Hydrolase [Frankiales bacterium]